MQDVVFISPALYLGLLGMMAVTPPSAHAQRDSGGEPVRVVEEFVQAFNAHDVSAMTGLVTEDIELYYADENGVFTLASGSEAQLAEDMEAYFAARPTVASRIEGIVAGPAFVSFRERIVGGPSSLSVYEVRAGLIRRVWYFPAEDP